MAACAGRWLLLADPAASVAAVEALAAVLGSTNSLRNALDEVLALPSDKAAQIALRTQQVIAEETGVANVADPLGGSWYVEALTDRLEAQAEEIFAQIRELGAERRPDGAHPIGPITSGLLAGIESGWFTGLIADAAYDHQLAMEDGRKRVVGVNVNTDAIESPLEILRVSHEVEQAQVQALSVRRAARDGAAVGRALAALAEASRGGTNLVPLLIDAARVEATLGEMCEVLRLEWGTYREPV